MTKTKLATSAVALVALAGAYLAFDSWRADTYAARSCAERFIPGPFVVQGRTVERWQGSLQRVSVTVDTPRGARSFECRY